MTVLATRTLLEVVDLSVRAAGPPSYDIVSGVNLALAPGEVFGLVGESGSGKTTTALALLGYARHGTEIRGSVRIEDTEIIAASPAARSRARGHLVAYVPQDPTTSLNPALRIGLQLDEMMAPGRREQRNLDRSRIEELVTKVGLPYSREFLRRYPHQLSGGQLQRVCIAMAMLNRPRLIVFDEPTTGLDVTTQGRVLETIRQLVASEDAASVYVTHDLAVIGEIASRVGVMYAGVMVEEASTKSVLHHSGHPYTKRLVTATPSVTERRQLVGITGTPLNPKNRSSSCPFAPRCQFVEDACTESMPELVTIGIGHESRCRRADVVLQYSGVAPLSTERTWETTSAAKRPLVTLAGVHASYGQHPVLFGVDVAIAEGKCLALVGESGSGKTTLARCVSGIHPDAVEGYFGFGGASVPWKAKERRPAIRQEIQYIFQNPQASLNPRHTIGRIVAQPLSTFEISTDAPDRRLRVRELLERVALPADYEFRYPAQLSGGERQRVAIARALAAEPKLLVCDEITSSLDVSIQASILELLGQLRRQSELTMLFITHNLGLVRAIADEIVILQAGNVVERGSADEVLNAPTHAYTRELLENTPIFEVGKERQ